MEGIKALEGTDQTLDAEKEQEESKEKAYGNKQQVVPGIMYLGHIPPHFRPLHIRNLLSTCGEVRHVFFQAEDWFMRCKKKAVAALGGKKSSPTARTTTRDGWSSVTSIEPRAWQPVYTTRLWVPAGAAPSIMTYGISNTCTISPGPTTASTLPLSTRCTGRQRLRAEVPQAKCETVFYLQSVERGQRFFAADGDLVHPDGSWTFAQQPTEQELMTQKAAQPGRHEWAHLATAQGKTCSNKALLVRIFGAPPPSESVEGPSIVRDS
uniref:Uncharacterized protein n=1 Tax=Piliocolobus tephrosceles TaxID=591936 RepID=A0A8C9IYH4_9PRIM